MNIIYPRNYGAVPPMPAIPVFDSKENSAKKVESNFVVKMMGMSVKEFTCGLEYVNKSKYDNGYIVAMKYDKNYSKIHMCKPWVCDLNTAVAGKVRVLDSEGTNYAGDYSYFSCGKDSKSEEYSYSFTTPREDMYAFGRYVIEITEQEMNNPRRLDIMEISKDFADIITYTVTK